MFVESVHVLGISPQALVNRGHTVANEPWTPTYYMPGRGYPDMRFMYETWTPDRFEGNQTVTPATRNLGSLIHVWCDNPNAETQDQIAAGIRLPLRALAQQTWGSPKPVATYAQFTPIADLIGRAPGWSTGTTPTAPTYRISTGGKALDNPGNSTTAGTRLITWTAHSGANQQWKATPQADGTVTLTNGSSGMCVDVNGTAVVQNPCTGATSQKWRITGAVISTPGGLVLTTASTADNAQVSVAADTGSALQRWTLTAV